MVAICLLLFLFEGAMLSMWSEVKGSKGEDETVVQGSGWEASVCGYWRLLRTGVPPCHAKAARIAGRCCALVNVSCKVQPSTGALECECADGTGSPCLPMAPSHRDNIPARSVQAPYCTYIFSNTSEGTTQ